MKSYEPEMRTLFQNAPKGKCYLFFLDEEPRQTIVTATMVMKWHRGRVPFSTSKRNTTQGHAAESIETKAKPTKTNEALPGGGKMNQAPGMEKNQHKKSGKMWKRLVIETY